MPPDLPMVIFLDENHHRNKKLCDFLQHAEVQFRRSGDYFPPGTPDAEWLPRVGEEGWALLTTDKRIRYRPVEKAAIERYRVPVFCFTSNNLTAAQMLIALKLALPRMKAVFAKQTPPSSPWFRKAVTWKYANHLNAYPSAL